MASVAVALALPLTGHTQQTAPSATQVPQAVQAPTVEALRTESAQSARQSARPAPEIDARVSLELQQADGQDTRSTLQRDTGHVELEFTLGIRQQLNSTTRLVAQLELAGLRNTESELNNSEDDFSYDLERLFIDYRPQSNVRLRAGRQALNDPMEAILDENLDGLAIRYGKGAFELELSYTRQDWINASTISEFDDIDNTLAMLRITPSKDTLWMPYVFHRATPNDTDRTWIGLQGIVEPDNSNWRYWIHASALDGDELAPTQADANGDIAPQSTRDVGGSAFDIGINWRAGGTLKATYTVAYARATGGSSEDRFRQSGLHDNDFALNNKNSFRYLGEVLDPELTNIQIITLGAGFEIAKDWELDFALHAYEQVEAEDQLRGSDIEFEPEGIAKNLGKAVDVIIGFEPNKQLQVIGTFGLFEPEDSFDADRDAAWLARAEVEYRF